MNIDSIFKSRYFTLSTKVHLVKAMVFPVVVYECKLHSKESWVLKNWCFWTVVLEKTLRVPWTARRSNQSILKEMSPGCSLEGLMLKLKLQNFSYLMCSFSVKRPWCWEKLRARGEGVTENEMVGWHHQHNGHEFNKLREIVKDKETWHALQRVGYGWMT